MAIKRVGIVGSGIMGSGVAEVAAKAGCEVVLRSRAQDSADAMVAGLEKSLGKQVEKGKMKPEEKDALVARIRTTGGPSHFDACDLVVEAATENVDLKLKLFRTCDDAMKPGAILASNTSSISLTKLAAMTKRPERVIGMHFMNPPPLMKLVEIVQSLMNRYGGGLTVPAWPSGDYDSLYIVRLTNSGGTITATFDRDVEGLNGLPTSCP